MRKIKIMEHVSLDGVMQHDNSEDFAYGGWTGPYRTPAGAAAVLEAQGSTFDLLLGRPAAPTMPGPTSGPRPATIRWPTV